MRILAVLAAALLLSGCTWLRHEFSPVPPTFPPTPAKPSVEPPRPPRKPIPEHVEPPPAPSPPQTVSSTPAPTPLPDYNARCHAMADSRANDARQLGASPADFAKVQQDVYHDCMSQSVKPAQ